MSMDGATWAKLYLNQADLHTELTSSKVTVNKGDATEAEAIFDMFDSFDMKRHLTIPEAE